MKKQIGSVIYSPSDLVRYFASWMDHCHLESPGQFEPEDQRLIAETGNQHELNVLAEQKVVVPGLLEVRTKDLAAARVETIAVFSSKVPIVFQAALEHDGFAEFADFVMLGADDQYQVWDTKLARSPKPYYAIQLCCYTEMLAAATACCLISFDTLGEKFGMGRKGR